MQIFILLFSFYKKIAYYAIFFLVSPNMSYEKLNLKYCHNFMNKIIAVRRITDVTLKMNIELIKQSLAEFLIRFLQTAVERIYS